MMLSRRSTLLAITATALLPGLAHADSADPRMGERTIGNADAKVTVQEWFSLTCTHCAEFQSVTFPQVKKELIETGKIRYVWRDYPLDQVALTAAMVARALPPERYEPFITTLLLTQDRWAFARDVNSTEELAKLAALAGMPRETFDKTIRDDTHRHFDLTRVGQLLFDLAHDVAGQAAGREVVDLLRPNEDPDLAAGLHGERALDAGEALGDGLEVLQALDVGVHRFAPSAGT